jgi:cell division protein FtsL
MSRFSNQKNNFIQSPKIFVILLVVLLFSAFWFLKSWQDNKKVNQEIENLEREMSILEKDTIEMEELIAYFNSQAFIEEKAREDLGLKNPGENVIVLVNQDETNQPKIEDVKSEENKESNFIKWWRYFFK